MINYKIKVITPIDTIKVRHLVLRAGKPIESCFFNNDELDTTIHLGIHSNEEIIGVCSLLKNSHNLLNSEKEQYQLRGMAILKEFQNKGLGNAIMKYSESILKKNNAKIIWCNARKIAVGFYKKNGYQIIGKPFHIETVGQHYIMYKKL